MIPDVRPIVKKRSSIVLSTLRWIVLSVCAVVAILALTALLYCSTMGFPPWLLDKMVTAASKGDFVIEIGSARLDLLEGLMLRDVRVFRKRVLGPPGMRADRVLVSCNPLKLLDDKGVEGTITRVEITAGVIEPFSLMGREETKPQQSGAAMEFEISLEDCLMQGTRIGALSGRMFADMHGMKFSGFKGSIGEGAMAGGLEGDIVYDTARQQVSGRLVNAFDPHAAISTANAWQMNNLAEVITRFDFGESKPLIEIEFTNQIGSSGWVTVLGKFRFENGSYQGVKSQRADGRFEVYVDSTNAIVTVGPMMVVRPEGMAQGAFTYEWTNQMIDFYGSSTMDPKALAQMVGIGTNGFLSLMRFDGPSSVTAKGCYDVGTYQNTDFTTSYEGRGLAISNFVTDRCSLKMRMKGLVLDITNATGTIYGGDFRGHCAFTLPMDMMTNSASASNVAYELGLDLTGADFARLAKVVGIPDDQGKSSRMSGSISLKGEIGESPGPMTKGEGRIAITGGRIFSLPIFGGLSALMGKVIPGLDFIMRQTDARADFAIADGKFSSDKILIEGDVLSLSGNGDYEFGGKLDFDVQIKLMKEHTLVAKLLRAITYPISKLFEFKLKGTRSEPYWYPSNFSKDLLEKIGLQSS